MGYHQAGFDVVGIDIAPQKRFPFEFIQADALEYLATADLSRYDAIHASPPCPGYSILRNLPWLREKEYPLLIQPIRELLKRTGKPWVIENVMGARWGAKGLAKRGIEAHGMQAGFLCGTMFGRPFYRHRLFETNFAWMQPGHPKHVHHVRDDRALGGRARDIVFRSPDAGGALRQPKVEWGLPRVIEEHPALVSADARGLKTWPGRRGYPAGTLNTGGAQGYGHQKGLALVKAAMQVPWMSGHEVTQAIPPCFTEHVGQYLMIEVCQ